MTVTFTAEITLDDEQADSLRDNLPGSIRDNFPVLSRHLIEQVRRAVPDPVQPLKQGDVLQHSHPDWRSWKLEILSVFGSKAWCKHSADPEPEERFLADLQRHIDRGEWELV